MTTTGKVILGIVVLVIILGGGYYFYAHSAMSGDMASTTAMANMPGMEMASTSTSSAAMQTTAATNTALPGGASDSDAALNQDAASIDTQMNGLNSDNANTSSSLNDQPTAQ